MALHLGFAALGIGPGDEVILADTNWIASAAPITYVGAKPVFVDVLRDSWCLDPARVAQAITPRTRAILAVHLYGNLCDMGGLLALGQQHDIPVIEDAAEAIGSQWHGGKRAGSMGAFGAFSFHGTKTLTTGEGGMFVTRDADLYEKALTLSNHGRARGETRQFWPAEVGFKYKMSNLQAAIGCGQMERVEELVARKRAILQGYRALLAGLPLQLNPEPAGTVNGCWMPTIVAQPGARLDRNGLLADFQRHEIDGRVFFWPLSSLPMFEPVPANVVSRGLCERAINLPSYHDMTDEDQQRVCALVRRHVHPA